MISKFGYGLLIVIIFFVLHVSLIDDAANYADHIPEKGSAAKLNDHYDDDFCIILRSDITKSYSNGCCHCPVYGIYVLYH